MSLSLDNLKLNQSASWLENVLEMHDESKLTFCISNRQNFICVCQRDLQKQALHSWNKVLQKSGVLASGSMFTFYFWGLYKLCIITALQNHNISLSLDQISITIMEWPLFKWTLHSPKSQVSLPFKFPVEEHELSTTGYMQDSCLSSGRCWSIAPWNVNSHLSEVQVKLTL